VKGASRHGSGGRRLTLPKRVAVHGVLCAGAVLFLFPFVWLVTTSLKPIEQTMRMPPEWLPRATYAEVGGVRMKVLAERTLDEPSVIVTIEEGRRKGERVLLPASQYADGHAEVEVRVADQTVTMRPRATLEKAVPAGHWLVREKLERLPHEEGPPARWDCVAAGALETVIEPAWRNYDGAIRYTGYHEFSVLGRGFRVPMFVVYLYNTLVVAVLGVIGVVFSSALVAYGFARMWPTVSLGSSGRAATPAS